MKLVTVGSVAFDAIETPFGKTDKIVGGAGTFISLASSFFAKEQGLISVVGAPLMIYLGRLLSYSLLLI
jgi:hypothetical protein